jgi:hypothetical protein
MQGGRHLQEAARADDHHVIPSSKQRVFGALRYVKVFQKKCRFAPGPFDA